MTNEIKKRIEMIKRGEIPQGYKKTAVGIVPEEWEETQFGDLFEFYGGLGIARADLSDSGGIPYLHYGDMHKNIFTSVSYDQYLNSPKYDTNVIGDESYLLKNGDMVFLDASEDLSGTSRCVVVYNPNDNPFIAGLHTFRASSKNDKLQIDFKQYLTTPQMVKKQFEKLSSGFKVYGINRNTIKKVWISYPKGIKEQQRIADILLKWDKLIELQEKLIEKLEIQKKGLMQKLLTPKEGWEKMRLGDICSIVTGKLDVNAMVDNGRYPFFTCAKEVYTINNYHFDCEALLIAGNGSIGDIKYYFGKFNAYQRTYVLSNFKFPIKYVMYYLKQNFYKEICLGTQKSSMPYIKLGTLLKTNICYQPKEIENSIKNFDLLNKNITLQTQKLEKLKQQRKSIQQLLLTGIVRV